MAARRPVPFSTVPIIISRTAAAVSGRMARRAGSGPTTAVVRPSRSRRPRTTCGRTIMPSLVSAVAAVSSCSGVTEMPCPNAIVCNPGPNHAEGGGTSPPRSPGRSTPAGAPTPTARSELAIDGLADDMAARHAQRSVAEERLLRGHDSRVEGRRRREHLEGRARLVHAGQRAVQPQLGPRVRAEVRIEGGADDEGEDLPTARIHDDDRTAAGMGALHRRIQLPLGDMLDD